VIGPTIAAVLVATIGIGWCFIVNAISFTFVIASLLSLDTSRLHPIPPVSRAPGELRQGLRYAARVPEIARPLLMMALIGTFTFEFEVSLPLLARVTFHSGNSGYSWLLGAPIIGALSDTAGPRYALALGAAACLGAVFIGRAGGHDELHALSRRRDL
jgi:hypothetical protein